MRYRDSKFWNQDSNFLTLQTSEFKNYYLTRIFGIKNGIGIPLTMGVPEIRTINWNSQPRSASALASAVSADWLIAPPLQNVRVDTQYVWTNEEQKQQIRQLQEELASVNCV